MAFRLQAFQQKSSHVKTSFVGEMSKPSQAPSMTDESAVKEIFSAKAIDKLLKAIKSGEEDEAEMIQKRCEDIESSIEDIQTRIYASHKSEMGRWGQLLGHLQDNYDKELTKRQCDIRQLNGALATWVRRFLDMEELLLSKDSEKYTQKIHDILRILDRTQQLAVESLRDRERLEVGCVQPRAGLERHEGDFGEEIIELEDEG